MARAKFIWNDPEGRGRNRTVLFRHSFLLDGEPAEGTLHVFADTRYRLLVNGRVLGHGPARFFTAKPEADAWDILPALEPGRNTIAVMVNSTGAWTFHSEKSVGGLIAWGEAADVAGNRVTVTTDESWRAIESPGHRPDTHYMSFALNPAERLDARCLPPDWADADYDDHEWPPAVVVARQDHWGSLHPRSIPLLDESVVRPTACLGAWAARSNPDEDVYSLLAIARHGKSLHTNARVAVLTHIHSPRDQQVTFGAWWGRYWLNGEPLERVERDDVPYRQDRTAHFHEGWNTLFVYETWGHDWWDFYLALPREAELAVSAEREVDSSHTFLLGLWEDELAERADSLDLPFPEALPADLGPWHRWPRDRRAETPCRERAWKTFERIARPGPAAVAVRELAPRAEGASLSLLFDFGGEMLGRPVLDFTAAAGTVVDLAYTERLNADGTADVHGRYFVDMAERYVARDGRQTWQTFHPRGFRYLEVLVAGDLTAFDLHSVSLTRARYPVKHVGSFECSDPLLSEIWSLGQATLHACMEDAYLDCPWRERGLYAGDCLVEFATNLATFGDTQLLRRCIELFFLAQGESGLVPPCPHGLPPGRHPDYSAILVQCLWQYWAWTGDVGFLQDMREPLRRLLAGIEALTVEGAELLDGTDMNAYVDMAPTERGAVSCALNCFYQRAFADGARVLELVGDPAAEHYADRAARLAEAIRTSFWDAERGLFADRPLADVPGAEPSVAGNTLPLLYDIATPEQAARSIEWLAETLRHNARVPEPKSNSDYNVSYYFSFYALGALFKHGRVEDAEHFIRENWGRMLRGGAWTCWEHMVDESSRCHAWASAPTYYLSARVLGIQFPEPGNLSVVRVAPEPGSLRWARGAWPHPAGPLRVAWEMTEKGIVLDVDAPEGVRVLADPETAHE